MATIAQLLKKIPARQIVGFARSEAKAKQLVAKGISVRYGNFDDRASLEKAMQGIDKVLLISTTDDQRYQQHKNVIDAAKKAGVKQIAYTSGKLNNVDSSPLKSHLQSHFQTEDYIKNSGLSYTIFRNTLYAEVIPVYVGEAVFESGIHLPAGKGKVPYALRREMGEAIGNALLQKNPQKTIYTLTGSKLYSYYDIASALSEISGQTVCYIDVDPAPFPKQLKQRGMPDLMIAIVSGFAADIKNRQYELVRDDLEQLLGRKPAPLKAALKEIYSL